MFGLDQDEVFYKNLHQSNSANFHHVQLKLRNILLILSLDGTILCFYTSKLDDILVISIDISTLLPACDISPIVDVTSSSILKKLDDQYLLVCCLVNGESKLLLIEILNDSLNPFCHKQSLDLDYHPCVIKNINLDSGPFLAVSGSNETVNVYTIDDGRLSCFYVGEVFPLLSTKIDGVVLCSDLMYSETHDHYWFAIGTDAGCVTVWRVVSSTNEILNKIQHKFDTPVSVLQFFNHSSSDGPFLLASSAIGPAVVFSSLHEGLLTESIKFRQSDKYDVIVTHFSPTVDENEITEMHAIFGTFGYKLLLYSINFFDKTSTLKFVKDYLSPVIGFKKFNDYFVVLTASGIHFYKT